jgi:hypothetical protein
MAADDYNRPPQIVPREQMWDAVQAGLRAGDHAADGSIARISRASRVPRWVYFAAAAVLLLAAGIQIGRQIGGSSASSQVAQTPPAVTPPDGAAPDGGSAGTAPEPRTDVAAVPRTDKGGRPARPGPREPERAASPALPNETAARAYSVVATQHLTEAEAMLTAFKGDLNQGRMDAQIASWGKDLLSNTRLLLDSPAASDPARRQLLQDLELILVQIVQLSPGSPARDRDLIEGALTDDQVLTRLRTALPLQKGT